MHSKIRINKTLALVIKKVALAFITEALLARTKFVR